MKLVLLFKEVNEQLAKERQNVALSKRRLLNHSKRIDKDKYLILTNKDKYNTNKCIYFIPYMSSLTFGTYIVINSTKIKSLISFILKRLSLNLSFNIIGITFIFIKKTRIYCNSKLLYL